MSSTLFLLNAIAITVLLVFQFQPDSHAVQAAANVSQYTQRQAPQLAVMNSQTGVGMETRVTQKQSPAPAATPRAASWVF